MTDTAIKAKRKRRKKGDRDYVDNKVFYEELVKYNLLKDKAREEGRPLPIPSDAIGRYIMLIVTNLSTRSNYSGYTWRDEMIFKGIDSCVAAIDNFNIKHETRNPHAYFSMIADNAFKTVIKEEKVNIYTKHKNLEYQVLINGMGDLSLLDNDLHRKVIHDFETSEKANKEKKKKAKLKKGPLDAFIEEV